MDLRVQAEYDDGSDSAHIAFDPILDGEVTQNIVIDDPRLQDGEIVVDLDSNGHVLGIEVIGVRAVISRPHIQ